MPFLSVQKQIFQELPNSWHYSFLAFQIQVPLKKPLRNNVRPLSPKAGLGAGRVMITAGSGLSWSQAEQSGMLV